MHPRHDAPSTTGTYDAPRWVHGVPVFFAPRGDGPCAGGIVFRVGVVDEAPRWRGVSHLVEHLALAPLAGTSSHHNGETTIDTTNFYTQGSLADVVEFLGTVCAHLSDLPTAELDREKTIIRTEEAGRSRNVAGSLALYRFGARSYGRASLPEWGLHDLGADDAREWARRYFTRGNAVGWIVADELPAELRLPLPDGRQQPAPPATSALPQTPAYYAGGTGLIAWSGVVERSTPAVVLAQLLRRDLFRSLRTEAGLSYDVAVLYQLRSGGVADLLVSADALEDKQDAALEAFLQGLSRMRLGQLSADDLEALRAERLDAYARSDVDRLLLSGRVYDQLVGHPLKSLEQAIADLEAVTPDDVARIGRQAFDTGLLRVPSRCVAASADFVRAPDTSTEGLDGHRYPAYENPAMSLTVGATGVSWSDGSRFATVPYADCEALIVYPDGGRGLVGADGMNVQVEPTLYAGIENAIAGIDAGVPPTARVRVPRAAEDVPQVDLAALDQRQIQRRSTPASRAAGALLIVLLVLGWVVVAMLALAGVTLLTDGDGEGAIALTFAAGFAGLMIWAGLRWRGVRRGH